MVDNIFDVVVIKNGINNLDDSRVIDFKLDKFIFVCVKIMLFKWFFFLNVERKVVYMEWFIICFLFKIDFLVLYELWI